MFGYLSPLYMNQNLGTEKEKNMAIFQYDEIMLNSRTKIWLF